MTAARFIGLATGLILGCHLTLVGSLASASTVGFPFAGATSDSPSLGHSSPDSVRCVSGAAASDVASVHSTHASSNRKFAPRWHQGAAGAVTVHIEDAPRIAGWSEAYRDEVISALRAWESTGSRVVFDIVPDSVAADVRIHWIDKFAAQYDGWTTVTWNGAGWLVGGDIALSVHSPTGQLLTAGERDQVMLHEVGHVLGLSHSSNAASIMRPNVKVTAIAPMDVKVLSALYQRPDSSLAGLPAARRSATADRCGETN